MVPLVKSKRRQREIRKLVEAAEMALGLEASNGEVLAYLLGRRCKVGQDDIFNVRGADRGYLCPLCSVELRCPNCYQPADYGASRIVRPAFQVFDATALERVESALDGYPLDSKRLALQALRNL